MCSNSEATSISVENYIVHSLNFNSLTTTRNQFICRLSIHNFIELITEKKSFKATVYSRKTVFSTEETSD